MYHSQLHMPSFISFLYVFIVLIALLKEKTNFCRFLKINTYSEVSESIFPLKLFVSILIRLYNSTVFSNLFVKDSAKTASFSQYSFTKVFNNTIKSNNIAPQDKI